MKFTTSDYRRYVKMSHRRHLLVEGRDDKRAFKILLVEVAGLGHGVDIDSAQDFQGAEAKGNGAVVEEVSTSISGTAYSSRFLGFADREFRGFQTDPELLDELGGHCVQDRLVWSRGHSLENYLFDPLILHQSMRLFDVTDYYEQAHQLFASVFESAVRLACTVSLASVELLSDQKISNLRSVQRMLNSRLIKVDSGEARLDTTLLRKSLVAEGHLDPSRADAVFAALHLWEDRVRRAQVDTARWLCHGHVGLGLLWSVYGACVRECASRSGCTRPESEAQKALGATDTIRLNACLDNWCSQARARGCEYPHLIVDLLGVESSRDQMCN